MLILFDVPVTYLERYSNISFPEATDSQCSLTKQECELLSLHVEEPKR